MRFFINPTSKHPAQEMFESRPGYQRWGAGVAALIIGVVLLPLSLMAFFPNLFSLGHLATREEIVNVNFVAFFVGGAFLPATFFMGSYTVLIHRRVIIPEELAEPFRAIFAYSFKTAM